MFNNYIAPFINLNYFVCRINISAHTFHFFKKSFDFCLINSLSKRKKERKKNIVDIKDILHTKFKDRVYEN